MTEQQENLERVSKTIAGAVFAFCIDHEDGREFTANELFGFVRQHHPNVAPDSPRRILTDLRERGFINYEIMGAKRNGKYTIIGVDRGGIFNA